MSEKEYDLSHIKILSERESVVSVCLNREELKKIIAEIERLRDKIEHLEILADLEHYGENY